MSRLPPWMRKPLSTDAEYGKVSRLLGDLQLHTVCRSAHCPNRHECWNRGTATFMILGDRCTRNCRFCAVDHQPPGPPDPDEPARLADAAARLKLRHVVITSVTRDDLPDGGAGAFAASIRAVRAARPGVTIEVLTPDFQGREAPLRLVYDAHPNVFNHNLETVRRLQAAVRPQASYARSLAVLRMAASWEGWQVKSGLMLGMGETDDEIREALEDLYAAGVRLLTLGQYMAPSRAHWPVDRYVAPEAFETWGEAARAMGFTGVASGPLVRSSYEADRLMARTMEAAVPPLGGAP